MTKKVLFLFFFPLVYSLICYETDEKTGELIEIKSDGYVYCEFYPKFYPPNGKKFVHPSSSGILADEVDYRFKKFFHQKQPFYEVMSFCLYEKYDFGRLWKALKLNSSKFDKTHIKAEYQFRCVCNYDLCNDPKMFMSLLSR